MSCVWMLQTLCKYDLRKGDLFVLSWARVQRVRRGSLSSELLVCGGGDRVRRILLLPLVARCLETIDVCIDILLVTLRNSGLGCHINGTYMGALSYADITLSCPSVHSLNKMMNICSDFATNHFINFNAKKTICIKYGESVRLTEHVILDGNVIPWHT